MDSTVVTVFSGSTEESVNYVMVSGNLNCQKISRFLLRFPHHSNSNLCGKTFVRKVETRTVEISLH